ncbi:MAG: response regulator [Bacteroidales bacterium]|nr:response regulator [Bacteroidales bacterium]
MRILLLEDLDTDAYLVKKELEASMPDSSLKIASNIKQARKLLKGKNAFDVALLDMKLPDGSGSDILFQIRQMELETAVVMLTGYSSDEVAAAVLRAGADDYLVKQGNYLDQLAEIIKVAIDNFKKSKRQKLQIIDVLYIEDDINDVKLTSRHMDQYAPNIHIHHVNNPEEALQLISKGDNYSIILLDYQLPGLSALELIKKFRQQMSLRIPIILVTGKVDEEIVVQSIKMGANNYVPKSKNYLFRLQLEILNAFQQYQLEQKQAELTTSESKYRLLAENAGDLIFVLDMDLKYTYMSPAIKSLRGYEPEEAMKQTLEEVLVPSSYERVKSVIQELIESVESEKLPVRPKLVEAESIKKDKSTVWTEVKLSPFMDNNNNMVGILGVSRDISLQKETTEVLKKLSTAIEQSPAAVIITDTKGRLEYVNSKFTEISGYSLKEVKGKTPSVLKSGHKKEPEYAELWNTILSGEEWRGEFKNTRKDGTMYWVQASISSIKDAEGKITHFLAVEEDITDKKKMIEELVSAKEKAEESNRLKSNFLANISHEIRTPMNGILGFTRLLQEKELSKEERLNYLSILKRSGDRMLTTIDSIIKMAQIEAESSSLKFEDTNIVEVIDELYNLFQLEAAEKEIDFRLSNQLPGDNFYIVTDGDKLKLILSNLIKNAIKFTSEGFVAFGVKKEENNIFFSIEDTGIGISPDKLKIIFNRFEKVDSSLTRSFEGVGLGLAIAKEFAEQLGGKIIVESEENKGSTFILMLPSFQYGSEAEEAHAESEDQAPDYKGRHILVVEDDEINFNYIEEILAEYDFNLLRAQNGEESVKICRENPEIALVLMDIKLPVMDGYEATREIKKIRPELPVIAQTAYAQDTDREKALNSGCTDFIVKPFTKEELYSVIIDNIPN